MEDYPEELISFPLPVVGLIGNESIRENIVKFFSTKVDIATKQEQPIFHFLHLSNTDTFPSRKERKSTLEIPIPDGIIKAGWMHKHSKIIPAVVVFLFDGEQLKTQEQQIVTDIETIRKNLRGRNTKFVVAIFAGKEPMEERMSSFRKRVDLESKLILSLEKDNLIESTRRLEKTVLDVAKQYYKEEGKKVKKDHQKSNLNKHFHQSLFVRHYFKMGYFAEFRKDTRVSLKYYNSSYNYLRELASLEEKRSRAKLPEIKVVAEYIHFKLCKIHLFMGNVNESVIQFQKHIKSYKSVIGLPELEFQHWAWMSRQHEVFGQLLNLYASPLSVSDREKHGAQQPGFYFQTAAKYAISRKKSANKLFQSFGELVSDVEKQKPFNLASIDLSKQKYVGQGPEERDHPLEGTTEEREKSKEELVKEAIIQENNVAHSEIIISLLLKAEQQFKPFEAVRMESFIMAQLAEEYFYSGQFSTCKQYLDDISIKYRKEGWWSLLTSILKMKAECCRQLGLTQEYVECAFELISNYTTIPVEERKKVQESIFEILKDPSVVNKENKDLKITTFIDYAHPLLLPKVRFSTDKVHAKDSLSFAVKIGAKFPLPIRFSKISVLFSDSTYNREIQDKKSIDDTSHEDGNLLFVAGNERTFNFDFLPENAGDLKCTSIDMALVTEKSEVHFIWNVQKWPDIGKSRLLTTTHTDHFIERSTVKILDLKAQVDVQFTHLHPVLMGEYYKIGIHLKNLGEKLSDGHCELSTTSQKAKIFALEDKTTPIQKVSLSPLEKGGETVQYIYLLCPATGRIKLNVKVVYETESQIHTSTEKELDLNSIFPFNPHFSFFTPEFHPISPTMLHRDEPFFLCVDLKPNGPALEVSEVTFVLDSSSSATVQSFFEEIPSQHLKSEHKLSYWFKIKPLITGNNQNLGHAKIKYKRILENNNNLFNSNEEIDFVDIEVPIPLLTIKENPFAAEILFSPVAKLGNIFPCTFKLTNNTDLLQEFTFSLTENRSFLFSGQKHTNFSVLPHATHIIELNYLPMITGRQVLPHLRVISKRFNRELNQTKQKYYIFVKPN